MQRFLHSGMTLDSAAIDSTLQIIRWVSCGYTTAKYDITYQLLGSKYRQKHTCRRWILDLAAELLLYR